MGNFMKQNAAPIGAGVGAAAGSVIPGVGTGLGASLGGSAGAVISGNKTHNLAAQAPVDPIGQQHMATLQLIASLMQAIQQQSQQQSPAAALVQPMGNTAPPMGR